MTFRKSAFLVCLLLVFVTGFPEPGMAQGLPKLSIGVEPSSSPSDMSVSLQVLLLLTVLSLAPSIVITMTSFTRIIGNTYGRVSAKKPTPEFEDLFGRLSEDEMRDFKKRMTALADALDFAWTTADPVAACERLAEVFGPDFPIPKEEETGEPRKAPAIITSSSSA